MNFLTPAFAIAGILACAIPILIFLLWRQRKKPVEWGAMRFLLEAYRRSRSRLRLEKWLLLALRCLALGLAGFALARPMLDAVGLGGSNGNRVVFFVIDDGMTSGVLDNDGTAALAASIDQARDMIDGLLPGDRVGILTTARSRGSSDVDLLPATANLDAARGWLRGIEAKPVPSDFPAALARLQNAIDDPIREGVPVSAVLLSEFRAGSAPLEEALAPLNLPGSVELAYLTPASEQRTNIAVTTVEPVRSVLVPGAADGSGQIVVRLERAGGELTSAVTTVRLSGEDLPATDSRTVEWDAGQREASVDFRIDGSGLGDRTIAVTASIDHDSLPVDDERHAVLEARSGLRIVLVDRRRFGQSAGIDRLTSGEWMRRALIPTDESPIVLETIEPASLVEADIRDADVVLTPRPDLIRSGGWEAMRSFVDRGGIVLVSPPAELTVHQWTDDLLRAMPMAWNFERQVEMTTSAPWTLDGDRVAPPLLSMIGSDLGELVAPIAIDRLLPVDLERTTRSRTLLALEDGRPFLISGVPGTDGEDADSQTSERETSLGLVLYLAAAPELSWTNLPTKPLMVPLMQEIARQGVSTVRRRARAQAGEQPWLGRFRAADQLRAPGGQRLTIDSSGRPVEPLMVPATWTVVDAGEQKIGLLPVNVDPAGSRTEPQTADQVATWLESSGTWTPIDGEAGDTLAGTAEEGASISGLLLTLLLIVLILETLLARWFSHASTESRGGLRSIGGFGANQDPDAGRPAAGSIIATVGDGSMADRSSRGGTRS